MGKSGDVVCHARSERPPSTQLNECGRPHTCTPRERPHAPGPRSASEPAPPPPSPAHLVSLERRLAGLQHRNRCVIRDGKGRGPQRQGQHGTGAPHACTSLFGKCRVRVRSENPATPMWIFSRFFRELSRDRARSREIACLDHAAAGLSSVGRISASSRPIERGDLCRVPRAPAHARMPPLVGRGRRALDLAIPASARPCALAGLDPWPPGRPPRPATPSSLRSQSAFIGRIVRAL